MGLSFRELTHYDIGDPLSFKWSITEGVFIQIKKYVFKKKNPRSISDERVFVR